MVQNNHPYIYNKLHWLALVPMLLLVLVSCSGSEELFGNDGQILESKTPVSFSAVDNWNTLSSRGNTVTSFHQGDAIGVFAYYRPRKEWGDDVQEFMINQKVVYDGSNWNYSPVKYWPETGGDVVFYAYAPYDSNKSLDIVLSTGKNKKGNPVGLAYNVSNDVEKQEDLLCVEKELTYLCASHDEMVTFPFSHMLSRLVFSAKASKKIKSIERIALLGKDKISNVGTKNVGSDNHNWTGLGNNAIIRSDYYLYKGESLFGGELQADNAYHSIMNGNNAVFVIPQSNVSLTLKVLYKFEGDDKLYKKDFPLENQSWSIGKTYNYQLDLSDGVKVDNGLPEGYAKLTYVTSIDEGGVKSTPINLGILTNGGGWGVQMTLSYDSKSVLKHPIGAIARNDNKDVDAIYSRRFYGIGINGGQWHCGWGNQQFWCKESTPEVICKEGVYYTFRMNYDVDNDAFSKRVVIKKGDKSDDKNDYTDFGKMGDYFDSDLPVYLFGIYNPDVGDGGRSAWRGSIYDVWLSNNKTIMMHLIPCRKGNKEDNSVGMYDLIGQEYYQLVNGKGSDEVVTTN